MDTAKPPLAWPMANWTRIVLVSAFALGAAVYGLLPVIASIGRGFPFGWDAVGYVKAARALLSGGDPWSMTDYPVAFAAPPPSLIPYLPFAWMPDLAVQATWAVIGVASALYIVRTLGLPWWWLLFPPLVAGVAAGSAAVLATALMVKALPVTDALAVAARIYAGIPLFILGRWRSVVAALVLILVTAPFLDWTGYIDARERVAAGLAENAAALSAVAVPWTIPFALLGLVLMGRERAAWLVIPVLWPATQLYYAVIALPVLARMPWVAMSLALPVPGLVVVGMVGQWWFERSRS